MLSKFSARVATFARASNARTFTGVRSESGTPIVNSHTEWDPLEEVIVGRVEGATVPEFHVAGQAVWPEKQWNFFRDNVGKPFPQHLIDAATKELNEFQKILEHEGVIVQRPEVRPTDFSQSVKTPDWESPTGLYAAMPRDILITIGNEIIEAPMAWRSRFFEYRPYRKLIREYFQKGAKWTAAPKPEMTDDLFITEEEWLNRPAGQMTYVSTEYEPIFDAAEFTRMGRDIFVQRSHVTNEFGIEWMRRHLGPDYNVHVLDFQDKNAMHIDGTFIPLGPGKVLICPKRPCVTGVPHTWYTFEGKEQEYRLPEMFKGWEVFVAPTPQLPADHPLYFTSPWTASCNILLLDEKRVIVEAQEEGVIKAFKDWGFQPIPVHFRNFLPFGGSFHCATCDVRRKGELRSVFE